MTKSILSAFPMTSKKMQTMKGVSPMATPTAISTVTPTAISTVTPTAISTVTRTEISTVTRTETLTPLIHFPVNPLAPPPG